jgi:hypothetical protein
MVEADFDLAGGKIISTGQRIPLIRTSSAGSRLAGALLR